nr:amidohydrolase family protein [uncultured Acidocella sp.]
MSTAAPLGFAPPPHLQVREEWLALRREAPLEPKREIVDAHHHLWDRPESSGRYLLDELLTDIADSGHNIVQTIYVQARSMYLQDGPEELRPVGEVQFARAVAEASAGRQVRACAGIVGCADLTLGDAVAPVLAALIEAGKGGLRGIRYPVSHHPDPRVRASIALPPPGVMLSQDFQDGARQVAKAGLSLDIWAYHPQLEEIEALARAVPELSIIVDHVGGPLGVGPFEGRRADGEAECLAGLRRLAALPNISLKLGGLAMVVSGFDFHSAPLPPSSAQLAQAWRPMVEGAIALFTPARCMFESNFPVDKGMVGYGTTWNAFKRLAAGYSEAEKVDLFAGTARRIYRI